MILSERLARIAPGLAVLARYRSQDLPHDVVAGLSVAAVALPVGVAYAELAGFNPVIGLYSSILPLAAYALFGSSRQYRLFRRNCDQNEPSGRSASVSFLDELAQLQRDRAHQVRLQSETTAQTGPG